MSEPKFDGATINIGGQDYIVPALSLSRIRKLRTELETIQGMSGGASITDEQLDAAVSVVSSALQRNYPELTRESVEDMIDLGNLGRVFQAVMGVSGFVPGGVLPGTTPAT